MLAAPVCGFGAMGAVLDRAGGLEFRPVGPSRGRHGRGAGTAIPRPGVHNGCDGRRRLNPGLLRRLPGGTARRSRSARKISRARPPASAATILRSARRLAPCAANDDSAAPADAVVAARRRSLSDAPGAVPRCDCPRPGGPLFRPRAGYPDLRRACDPILEGTRRPFSESSGGSNRGLAGLEDLDRVARRPKSKSARATAGRELSRTRSHAMSKPGKSWPKRTRAGLRRIQRRLREFGMVVASLASSRHPILVHLIPVRRCNLACTYCNEFDDVSQPVPIDGAAAARRSSGRTWRAHHHAERRRAHAASRARRTDRATFAATA